MLWEDLNKADKVSLIVEVWDENCSATTLAAVISERTRSTVKRNSIMSIYTRTPELQINYPLGGRGVAGQRQLRDENGAKLPRQHTPPRKTRRERLAETTDFIAGDPKVKPRKVWISPEAQAYDKASRHVRLHEVGHNQCSWPVNDPPIGEPHLFCGHETAADKHYCPHHQERAHPPLKETIPWSIPATLLAL
jgi:hypothetical protein